MPEGYCYFLSVQRNWSRRKFVTVGLSATGVSLVGALIESDVKRHSRGYIRLLPVDGVVYSESFTRFMQRARFDSVRDALASIRDRSLPVGVSHIRANDPGSPQAWAPASMVCQSRRSGNSRTAEHFPENSRGCL
jgi:hypothetical protein